METITAMLNTKTTEELLTMVETVRLSNENEMILVWDALIEVLEDRIGDKVWDL